MMRDQVVVVATVLVHSNPHGLREVLRRVDGQSVRPHLVMVVDNGSLEPVAIDDGYGVPVALVRTDRNLGVGGGHNLAIRSAFDNVGVDAVWVLEHDTFPEPGCLESLLAVRDTVGEPGVVVAEVSQHHYQRVRNAQSGVDGEPVTRFTLNGPLVDRDVFTVVGMLDEEFFVGQEDFDFSRRVVAAGLPVRRCCSGEVLHAHRGQRQFGSFTSPLRLYYSSRGLQWLNPAKGAVARVCSLITVVAKSVAEVFRPGRGPTYARARWWAYVDAIKGRMGPTERRFR